MNRPWWARIPGVAQLYESAFMAGWRWHDEQVRRGREMGAVGSTREETVDR